MALGSEGSFLRCEEMSLQQGFLHLLWPGNRTLVTVEEPGTREATVTHFLPGGIHPSQTAPTAGNGLNVQIHDPLEDSPHLNHSGLAQGMCLLR